MKNNFYLVSAGRSPDGFLHYLLRPDKSGLIIILLLLFNVLATAQDTPATVEFPISTPIFDTLITNPVLFDKFEATGFNTIVQRADNSTQGLLEDYDLLAVNADTLEYIYHYSTAYYSKWEAEQNQTDLSRVGVKHSDNLNNTFGEMAFWDSAWCWSTIGLSSPTNSLMYGPHYRQEKRYKRWHYGCTSGDGCLSYTPRFRMALHNPNNVNANEDVCIIKVVFRWREKNDTTHHDETFMERTLKVGDFDTAGKFDDFYLHVNPDSAWYEYFPDFILPKDFALMEGSSSALDYIDWEPFTGIQFCVDWLRSDTLCTLYIDYAEVYDNYGWNDFIREPEATADLIKNYADSFSSWDNIEYWVGTNEPYTIDSYTPIHIVDSLIRSVQAPPLVVHFDPSWWYDFKINGEDEIEMFYNIAKPEKIYLGVYPVLADWNVIRPYDLEWLRFNLQRTSLLDPNFWFKAQCFGFRRDSNNEWCIWRKPKSPELMSMVMLGLAHGAKGIDFEWFDSQPQWISNCSGKVYIECLVNNSGIPENNEGDILYNTVKNNLIPRLKGKLGKTLMGLDYTGNYINIEYQEQPPEDNEQDYLSIQHYGMSYFWHAGFFNYNNFPDNKYFLLTNLRVNYDVEAKLIVSNNTGYENVSFTDIEGGIGRIDTTIGINSSISHYEIIPKGEGRLYRVAPVIKFGGRLLYPEVTQPGMTLQDDMIIENGATMTVYSTYTANANITVKHGTIQLGENGKIIFGEGKKLIVEGACTISGTSGDKLQLVFSEPLNDEEPTGIMIKAGGSLTINNCKIENATIGIESLLNANYLNVQNVDFINCSDIAVSIAGYGSNQILTPPTPQIMYCTIQNSKSGIWATNLSQIVIRENQLMNTDLGVFLSNVSTSAVIGNTFTGTKKSAGVFLESCNGVVRGNWITNHSNGIHLANSSPDIGGNSIFHNWNRAIYVGFGSLPNMEGKLVQDPAHLNLFYAVSGYNRIYENGGWTPEDDGSEIYVDFANVVLRRGCNQIYDSRTPNTNDTPPLYNTQLLMNCSSLGYPIEIYAEHNYWGDHSIYLLEARFGDCDIYYEPFLEQPCPEPDRSGSKLLITSATGETVDTLYEEQRTIGTLTETEEQYSIAEETFLTGDLVGALQIYETIITGNVSEEEKYFAYQRKYEIGRLTYESSEFFNDMHNTFIALASNADDSLSMKRLTQLSTLSKVGEQEYEMAIGEFDGIVQQNPNTEEAAYAEIDALTTALLIEEVDTTLQKGRLGKYLVKSSSDYNSRVNEILHKHFGTGTEEAENEILPTEYTLYQNYPNPFNPATTIKYDLPNVSEVSLIIYDILGREVKDLVNTKQPAGRYEIKFNASPLASGIYIYQLIAEKFISSKKMILLK